MCWDRELEKETETSIPRDDTKGDDRKQGHKRMAMELDKEDSTRTPNREDWTNPS